VGISIVDARTGEAVFAHRAGEALNPASNMKLITAAGVLLELGADFRMLTGVYGSIGDGGVVQTLALKGYGDPTLRMSDLTEMAARLADQGVTRVEEVVVDGSYFDDRFLPPAFEQQPDEVAPFRAAVGAVSVDENAYDLRIVPGATAGAPATVRLDAAGYFELTNEITTSEAGEANVIAIQRNAGERMQLVLRGTVPLGIRLVSYRRRVEHPLAYAGHMMLEALRRAGIRHGRTVRLGGTPAGAPLLASRRSAPVAEILPQLGKESDNFVAEMLLKVLAAEKRARPGRSEDGAALLTAMLEGAGVPRGRATVINGSGLFLGNRVAPAHFTSLLSHVYRNPAVRSEYLTQLAVAGVDGTLASRMRDLRPARIVRAKTGTLNAVITLSGYVLGPDPADALAFSILANDVQGKHGEARTLADGLCTAMAESLHGRPPSPRPTPASPRPAATPP
jgi:D-alanyl-D-alanine carboxypeptidase/D-alanyl-D-alanine-endopeptidase (penicillin-binding protein 4)